ncbi:MAG: hypothetical protein ACKPKO_15190, partial [Candidatus Fonsibacter sp.]
MLLRMVDPEEFAKYDSMTPTALEYLADYGGALSPIEYIITTGGGENPVVYTPADVDSEPNA